MSEASEKFKDDLARLVSHAMPKVAPMVAGREVDAELLSVMITELASSLGFVIAFAHRGDPVKINNMVEGTVQFIFEGSAHFAEIQKKVAKLKPINLDGGEAA
jgi:hypothetical protein